MARPEFVWVFDANRRMYTKPDRAKGELWGKRIIWREHWAKRRIVGETSRSYVDEYGRKYPKKAPDMRDHLYTYDYDDVVAEEWRHEHGYRISDLVRQASYDQLKQVAEILGYAG